MVGERREAADIKDQNGSFAKLAAPDADVVLRVTDARRDAGIEETLQFVRRAALRNQADQKPPCPGEDYGDA